METTVTTLTSASNARKVRKIAIFSQYLALAFIFEIIQDRAVLMADQWSIKRRRFQWPSSKFSRSCHSLSAVIYPASKYGATFCNGEQWRHQGGPAGARAPAVKPCAPAVPRQLSYSDVDHKRISWLRARHYFEDVNYDVINITLNSFLVNMADIRLMFSTRSLAVAERPHDASCHWIFR